jgi:thioredoxin 1
MKKSLIFIGLLLPLCFLYCRAEHDTQGKKVSASQIEEMKSLIVTGKQELNFSQFKVTFIELGADKCIPCKAMQPVMAEIAKEYKNQIQVVFFDVWKDPQPGKKYGIKLIPTQIFIDPEGNEIFRHIGFFAKEEIIAMLKTKGIL